MADLKISQLTGATLPLAGTEVLPIVQSSTTKKVAVSDLTAGRTVSMNKLVATSSAQIGTVAQNETHEYLISNWDSVNVFVTRITSDYFGKTRLSTAIIATGSDPALGTYTEQIELQSGNLKAINGNFVQGTAAKGVNFTANTSAAGMTSQLLNWYEEGTWTPNQGAGLTVVGAFSSAGTYTRIGRQVFIRGSVSGVTSVAVASAGAISTNLPYSSAADTTGAAINADNNASSAIRISSTTLTAATAIAATATITFSATYAV